MGIAAIIFIVAMGGVAVALLSRVFFAGTLSFVKIKTKSVSALVLGKRKKDMYRHSGIYTNYFMCFDLGNGDRIELPVNKKQFKADNIGKRGVLTYKGEIFVSFILDEDKPKPKETYILNGKAVEK